MKLTETQFDKLGKYFTHLNIHQKYGISFERFIQLYKEGRWQQFIKEASY